MSEQEKKSGGPSAGGSSLVMVEQSAASRHKQPYRPTDMQDDAPELHHKRSKAPAVPSVTEEFKNTAENPDTIERKECERAMSSEKHTHNAAKKLSSNTKRRDSSPETIPMSVKDVETKKGTGSPIQQPIPAQVAPVSSMASKPVKREKAETAKKDDDDSITEEIADLRTPELAKKESEHWDDDNQKNAVENAVEPTGQDYLKNVGSLQTNTNKNDENGHEMNADDTEDQDSVTYDDKVHNNACKNNSEAIIENDDIARTIAKHENLKVQDASVHDNTEPKIPENESFKDTEEEEDIFFPCSLPGPSALAKLPRPINSQYIKRKEITWYDGEYLPKGFTLQELDSRSKAWMLERKMSVGPCFGTGISFGEPSGITICVPKKSLQNMSDFKPSQSGISITVSGKCIDKKRTKSGIEFVKKCAGDRVKLPYKRKTGELKIDELQTVNFLENIREKFGNVYGKIKNVLHF